MVYVANLACHDARIAVAGIKQELFNLVAADVAQNAAEEFFLVEPVRTTGTFAVRADAQRLHDAANCALGN